MAPIASNNKPVHAILEVRVFRWEPDLRKNYTTFYFIRQLRRRILSAQVPATRLRKIIKRDHMLIQGCERVMNRRLINVIEDAYSSWLF